MNSTELSTLTIKELKAIAQEKGIEVAGDKRSKQTWIDAIENHNLSQTQTSDAKILDDFDNTLVGEASPLENRYHIPQTEKMVDIPSVDYLVAPTKKTGAYIVLIVLAVILYWVCILPIGTGIVIYRAIRWGRDLFISQTLAFGNPRRAESIDYFPFPA